MKKHLNPYLLLFLMMLSANFTLLYGQSPKEYLYAGSFSENGSKGIYVFELNRPKDQLTLVQTVTLGKSPSFLALSPNKQNLYAAYSSSFTQSGGTVMSFKINPVNGHLEKLNERSAKGRGPAHVSVDPRGRFVYISNYGSGNLSVYKIKKTGALGELVQVIQDTGSGPHPNQKGPHVHSAIPSSDGKFVYVCDLGVDKLFIYQVKNKGKLVPGTVPFFKCTPGSGPRQFALSPDGESAALVEELISGLVFFKRNVKTGELMQVQHFSMLPDSSSERGSDATVYFSPDNRFVYATNWGPLGITVYSIDQNTKQLQVVDKEGTSGIHPRDICIDKNGEYVFVANMGSGNLAVLKRNKVNGVLSPTNQKIRVPGISCIVQLILNQ